MKRMFAAAAVAAAVLLIAGQASAQALPDPEGVIVEELVVRAKEPGPAWWRVKDADTTVYILGVGEQTMPAGLTWDRRTFDKRIKGANSLIIGTRISLQGKLRDIPALLRVRNQLKSKTPLEETLAPDQRARFVAARERLGKPAGRYAGWTPLVAGQLLMEDARGPKGASVVDPLLKAAKANKVKLVDPARYEAVPFLQKALAGLTPAIHAQCLDAAIDDVSAPSARAAAAARGWAEGDPARALNEPRSFEKCVLLLGGGAELWRRTVSDQADAVAKALETPGHSVAIIGLRPLLAEQGVLHQLRSRGVTVLGPGEG